MGVVVVMFLDTVLRLRMKVFLLLTVSGFGDIACSDFK